MRLEIRDIESTKVYDIGPEGAVLGRERARTDISLRDESISKRHARIFHQDGAWLLEDLNSSNGTYVDDQRITVPVRLTQGRTFSLAQRKFEVVYVEMAAPAPQVDPVGAPSDFAAPVAPFEPTGAQLPSVPALEPSAFGAPSLDNDEPEPRGFGYFFVALPRAFAFYLLEAPLMALNPIGRTQRSLHEQPLPAMTSIEIAAYVLPAAFLMGFGSLLLAAIGTALQTGTFPSGVLLGALPFVAAGALVASVFGLLLHPIQRFLIDLFKGQSTYRSRTNNIVHGLTLNLVGIVPVGLGPILVAANVPYLVLLQPLLSLLYVAVVVYYHFQWLKVFDVVKALQYVALVLGILLVLGAGFGLVAQIGLEIERVSIAQDGPARAPDGAMARRATEVPTDRAQSPGQDGPDGAPDLRAVLDRAAEKQQEAARLAAAKRAEAPSSDEPEARDNGGGDEGPDLAVALAAINQEKYPLGATEFVVFVQKRDAIERAIEADPSLVSDKAVKRDYERLWRITYEINEKYYRKRGPRWKKEKIYQREKAEETFRRTRRYVNRLYKKLILQ